MRSKRKRSFKQNYSFIYILTYFLALIALIYVCEHASLVCLSIYIYELCKMGIVLVLSLFLFLLRSAQKREYGFLNDYLILYIKKENYFKFNTKSIIIFFK